MQEKLVRDGIPRIHPSGEYRTARSAEMDALLVTKLHEEIDEFASAPSIEELADVLEALRACADRHGFGWDAVDAARVTKRSERGGFVDRVVMRTD